MKIRFLQYLPVLVLGLGLPTLIQVQARPTALEEAKAEEPLALPLELPEVPSDHGDLVFQTQDGRAIVTTLQPRLQRALQDFIRKADDPIASVVVVEVKTGRILALAQGRNPKEWGATVHTGLYSGFPAASIFKVVPTAAALEVVHIDPTINIQTSDRCKNPNPHGLWLYNFAPNDDSHGISLEQAFAQSCNSFFSKLAVQYLGVGLMRQFAEKFGWGHRIPADFYIPLSPMDVPVPSESNIQTVGRFAAGFGRVGMSPVHAAWIFNTLANKGRAQALRITRGERPVMSGSVQEAPIIDEQTSWQIRQIMHKTVVSGSARGSFHRRRYRGILPHVGGKTGSLTSQELKARITWFAGLMPYENPEVIVSSVVVIDGNRWKIRGPDLAAEAFYQWSLWKAENEAQAQIQTISVQRR